MLLYTFVENLQAPAIGVQEPGTTVYRNRTEAVSKTNSGVA